MSASSCSSARGQAGQSLVECERHAERLSGQRLSYESCPIKWASPHCCAGVMHSTRQAQYVFCAVLVGFCWARTPTRSWERIQGQEQACTNDKQIVAAHQFERPLDFVRRACHFHAVLTGYLWLSHSASKIVSDNAYEEPHDNTALSLHGAAPAPAAVNSNERPSLASLTHTADSAATTRSTEGSTSELPTVARLPARQQSPG